MEQHTIERVESGPHLMLSWKQQKLQPVHVNFEDTPHIFTKSFVNEEKRVLIIHLSRINLLDHTNSQFQIRF